MFEQNKKVILIALIFWFIIAGVYISHTGIGERAHDMDGHVQYTQIIINEHRLPGPKEGLQTYHLPLYYIINSLMAPKVLDSEKMALMWKGIYRNIGLDTHIRCVQAMSVLYGAIALVIIAWLLSKVTQNAKTILLVLLFIVSTPKFAFVFSTYNNDSLATVLSIAIIALSYRLYLNWSKHLAILLLIVATAGVYTKYSVLFAIGAILAICCKDLLKLCFPNKTQYKIIGILLLSLILLFPWVKFHNYHYTGKYFPSNFEMDVEKGFNFNLLKTTLGIVLKIPKLQEYPPDYTHEWDEPWSHPYAHPSTKRYDYFPFVYITSVIGEYVFNKPGINVIWLLLFIHFLLYPLSLMEVFRMPMARLAGALVLLSHLIHNVFMYLSPITPAVLDYRYIAWSWAGWAILYASALAYNSKLSWVLNKMLIIGFCLHTYTLLTLG